MTDEPDVEADGYQKMPRDLTKVRATDVGYDVLFYPSGYSCSQEQYLETYALMAQWNPLEVGGGKMAGLVERYLRTGDTHEEPENPFDEGEFIDEW